MKTACLLVALMLVSAPVLAVKNCETLMSEIEAKLQAKGVTAYSLDVVANEEQTPAINLAESSAVKKPGVESGAVVTPKRPVVKAVGSCDGGAKTILYRRE